MAQHDYVISNGTGAAVRSDLNNALLAIVSQNSGATEPTTTYAYQWWADTTTGLLKIRNSANNAWITLRELDGTLTIEDGTVSAPGLAFRDDLNTGIWRPGTDQFAISTNGVERVEWGTSEVVFNDGGTNYDFRVEGDNNANLLFVDASADAVGIGTSSVNAKLEISGNSGGRGLRLSEPSGEELDISAGAAANDPARIATSSGSGIVFAVNGTAGENVRIDSSGRVGIGTTSPSAPLHINGTANNTAITLSVGGTVTGYIGPAGFIGGSDSNLGYRVESGNSHVFHTGATERARIDSSGRWLLGTSSSPSSGDSQYARLRVQGNTLNTEGFVAIARDEAASGITSGEVIGQIFYTDSAGNAFGVIKCEADTNAGTNDYPGRLVFSTTADGASSPTERMRITSTNALTFGGTGNLDPIGSSLDGGFALGAGANTGSLSYYNSSNAAAKFGRGSNGIVCQFFRNQPGATSVGDISVTTTATTYNSGSDYRLKENIVPLSDGIIRLMQLKPSRFNFIVEPDVVVDGFIAHEAQEIVPQAVTGTKDAVDADGNPIYQGIDQSKLVPLLTAALQEAVAKIESLEARLTALESA